MSLVVTMFDTATKKTHREDIPTNQDSSILESV